MLSRQALRLTRPFLSRSTTISRRLCSESDYLDEETIRKLSILSDEANPPVREVILSEDGEELLNFAAEAPPQGTFDWGLFERRFGLDTYTEEDIARDWEELKKKGVAREEEVREYEERPKRPRTYMDKGSLKYVDKDLSIEITKDALLKEVRNDTSQVSETPVAFGKDNVGRKKEVAMDGSLAHMEAGMGAGELTKKTKTPRQGRTQSPDPIYDQIFGEDDALRQPAHLKKPGYERRLMSMEREMERIVLEILYEQDGEWYSEGGDVERVMLSPNKRSLTVYYNVEGANRDEKWWERTNAKYAKAVRTAFAKRLDTKYVPKVFFDQGGQKESKVDELDVLFQQIKSERAGKTGNKAGESK